MITPRHRYTLKDIAEITSQPVRGPLAFTTAELDDVWHRTLGAGEMIPRDFEIPIILMGRHVVEVKGWDE